MLEQDDQTLQLGEGKEEAGEVQSVAPEPENKAARVTDAPKSELAPNKDLSAPEAKPKSLVESSTARVKPSRKILVIRYGDLGDFAFSMAAFKAIRERHASDHIVLMTSKRYVNLARQSGFFNEIWTDDVGVNFTLSEFLDISTMLRIAKRMRRARFSFVYDLQNSHKTNWLFRLMGRHKPAWSGAVKIAQFPFEDDGKLHLVERHQKQLLVTGLSKIGEPDISWLKADVSQFGVHGKRYALVVLAGDKQDKISNWDVDGFADVAEHLYDNGIIPVFIGAAGEEKMVRTLLNIVRGIRCVNLVGQTNFAHIAELARYADFALGADSGVMDLISLTDCPTIYLVSDHASPYTTGTYGHESVMIHRDNLYLLSSSDVIKAINAYIMLYEEMDRFTEQVMEGEVEPKSSV